MAESGLFYARFMDDWVILAPTRWKLRRVIRIVNQILARLKVRQHPDKTFIGRVARGFDFLGYKIASAGLIGVARRTLEKFAMRRSQRKSEPKDSFEILCRMGDKLREQHGDVRYAEYILHTGSQWTRRVAWERLIDGEWVEIDLPLENY